MDQRKIANVFSMSSGLTVEDFGWGTATFHKMVGLLEAVQPTARLCNETAASEHAGNAMLRGCCRFADLPQLAVW